ncbi:electron transfer flavoprotein beta subunit [Planifilum fulgidum]|jgi:electron transfer flavoprotein beta subunit|uniref:Electron transfer flavoprotein subunit beta n=1 Tax=Planifilum fulgidum TaxID=201973 RepID=A0A1I2MET8_9BACL|nr:electron transfer flavoprotein subunit beta/FixA family protein [Planifilum fulgidum]MBO2496032.1 electron transfer flavoprotein subunit beta [Bacillota bacterium]MBO2532914.1 electron transfer flavoprotein subunit beta [Thermoactinomycetaceae bacterium]SFF87896.1 electron transfer flavoprotein beta subunit [Planifilum fulgidum]
MNILVCLKQTFDTEERIVLEDGKISEDGVEFVINPYDEYAVEEAIKLKEEHGGEVTVITVGPERAEQALRTAMAMGADKGIIVDSEDLEDADEYTIAKILAEVIKEQEYDIILCGYMAVDDGSAQVGPRLAELLGIPHISTITKLTIDGENVEVEKDVEGDVEIIQSKLPILLTAQQGLNEPRYPSLPGIMKAKKKPLERLDLDDLDLDEEDIEAKTETLEIFLPPKKEGGKILEGELSDQVKELVQLLRNEAKVI